MSESALDSPLVTVDQNKLHKTNVLVQSRKNLFHFLDYFMNTVVDLFSAILI